MPRVKRSGRYHSSDGDEALVSATRRYKRNVEMPPEEGNPSPGRRRRRLRPLASSTSLAPLEAHTVVRAKRDGWVYLKVDKLEGTLRWRTQSRGNVPGSKEIRWYFIGSVHICTMQVNDRNMPPGGWVVFINSRQGNSGIGFHTEDQAHEFILQELTRSPRDPAGPIVTGLDAKAWRDKWRKGILQRG